MELADGVYALELSMEREEGTFVIHPVAVETPTGVVLVDVGLPGQTDALAAALDDHGLALEDVRAVVVTHHDGDHAGGLAAVRERADGPVVYAHEGAVPYVDGRKFPMKSDPESDRYEPVAVDVTLRGEVTFRTAAGPMETVFTPGHAPGHLSLYLPEADLLLAVDALRSDAGELTGPAEHFTPNLPEATRSVGTVADLAVETVHCYHGGPVDADTADVERVYESLAAEHLD
ncbi:MBL fold metallo-hydrolase [Halobaculum sp. CBA1158]|uniref:MBL fold metallo-hydrolase n=1 Tax=Halobaculum sp. CBA1158 TaxID=2904243 RepID=UPI001F4509CD|nr:MBL fold metallo-hydrolase [Halobaculum sp. CBA1158]UIO98787.1 MBL fold metallo-hydrolase [Halobaculum sp. CBA1158]